MKNDLDFWDIGLWCVLVLISAFPHELSHFLVAKALGCAPEIVYSTYIPVSVTLSSSPADFNLALISLAGGIGASIFLYLIWRALNHRGTIAFAFFISMELSYAVLETMYQLGWIVKSMTYLGFFIGLFAAFVWIYRVNSRFEVGWR